MARLPFRIMWLFRALLVGILACAAVGKARRITEIQRYPKNTAYGFVKTRTTELVKRVTVVTGDVKGDVKKRMVVLDVWVIKHERQISYTRPTKPDFTPGQPKTYEFLDFLWTDRTGLGVKEVREVKERVHSKGTLERRPKELPVEETALAIREMRRILDNWWTPFDVWPNPEDPVWQIIDESEFGIVARRLAEAGGQRVRCIRVASSAKGGGLSMVPVIAYLEKASGRDAAAEDHPPSTAERTSNPAQTGEVDPSNPSNPSGEEASDLFEEVWRLWMASNDDDALAATDESSSHAGAKRPPEHARSESAPKKHRLAANGYRKFDTCAGSGCFDEADGYRMRHVEQ